MPHHTQRMAPVSGFRGLGYDPLMDSLHTAPDSQIQSCTSQRWTGNGLFTTQNRRAWSTVTGTAMSTGQATQ